MLASTHPLGLENTVAALSAALATGRLSSVELTTSVLHRASDVQARLNPFITITGSIALRQAAASDARRAAGHFLSPLDGLPIAVKDNLVMRGAPTTAASRYLQHYESPFDATVITRLQSAGAVIIGKTNLDEFAMGGSGEHSAFGPTRNPHDPARVPGGSSSGSAAVVGAGLVPVALGSDTGGSIRQPAGWCGIVGLKPTYGRVSRYGLIAFASSLDQIGPLGASPACVGACLHAIAGHDPLDSTSAHMPTEDFGRDLLTGQDRKALRHGAEALRAIKIGVPDFATAPGNSPGVQAAMAQAMDRVRAMGGQIVPIELPHAQSAIAAYYIIAPAEASSNLARFDGVRYGRRAELGPGDELMDLYCRSRSEGFGAEVQRRIMLGTHVLSSGYIDAYYLQALKVRRLIKQDYDHAFASGVSAVLTPSSPGPAFRLGEKLGDPLAMYLEDVYTVAVNLAGLPGITVPGGIEHVDGQALPIGLQLVGPSLSEANLLALADRLGTHQ